MADNMTSTERGLNKKIAAAVLTGGIVIGGIGYAATRDQERRPVATPTPSAAAALPTPEAKPTPTVTVVKTPEPSPTKTPEKSVPCLVIPEQYCEQADRVIVTTGNTKVEYIGVKDLPPGTPIIARKNGTLDKTADGAPFSGYRAVVRDEIGGTTYRGNLQFDNLFSKEVQQGDAIATIGSGDLRNFGYELLISITKRTPQGPIIDEDTQKQLFPKAYEKPAVSFNGGQTNPVPVISHSSATPSPK